jgi:glutathione S-transferase
VTDLTLHGYFRSSASYRVRIALALKAIPFAQAPVHLVREGGEQLRQEYRSINPDGLMPSMQIGGGEESVLTQSLAIVEYLDEVYPNPRCCLAQRSIVLLSDRLPSRLPARFTL